MEVHPLCPHINPVTKSARIDANGCRFPLFLRGSGTSANKHVYQVARRVSCHYSP